MRAGLRVNGRRPLADALWREDVEHCLAGTRFGVAHEAVADVVGAHRLQFEALVDALERSGAVAFAQGYVYTAVDRISDQQSVWPNIP